MNESEEAATSSMAVVPYSSPPDTPYAPSVAQSPDADRFSTPKQRQQHHGATNITNSNLNNGYLADEEMSASFNRSESVALIAPNIGELAIVPSQGWVNVDAGGYASSQLVSWPHACPTCLRPFDNVISSPTSSEQQQQKKRNGGVTSGNADACDQLALVDPSMTTLSRTVPHGPKYFRALPPPQHARKQVAAPPSHHRPKRVQNRLGQRGQPSSTPPPRNNGGRDWETYGSPLHASNEDFLATPAHDASDDGGGEDGDDGDDDETPHSATAGSRRQRPAEPRRPPTIDRSGFLILNVARENSQRHGDGDGNNDVEDQMSGDGSNNEGGNTDDEAAALLFGKDFEAGKQRLRSRRGDNGSRRESSHGLSPLSVPRASIEFAYSGYYATYFRELQKLGSGTFGGVYLCQHVMEGVGLGFFALKKIPVGDDTGYLQRVLREVRVLEEVKRHPNVIEYNHSWVEVAQTADFGPPVRCLFILMEYATEGAVDTFLDARSNSLDTFVVWYLFLSALAGIAHLHRKQILHRDLKPQNLLLTRDGEQPPRVLVSDFGTAWLLSDCPPVRPEDRTGGTGTLEYMAPELFDRGSPLATSNDAEEGLFVCSHTKASDVWSLGMVLHYLAFDGSLPARGRDGGIVLSTDAATLSGRPPEMIELMRAMLQRNPKKRPSCHAILNSPVVKKILRGFAKFSMSADDIFRQPEFAASPTPGSPTSSSPPRHQVGKFPVLVPYNGNVAAANKFPSSPRVNQQRRARVVSPASLASTLRSTVKEERIMVDCGVQTDEPICNAQQ